MNATSWICQAILVAIASVPLAAKADDWRNRCQSGKYLCVDVDVTDNGANATVSLSEPIYVSKGLKVVWRVPVGFAFADGDGVVVQTASGEIATPAPSMTTTPIRPH